MKTAEERRKYHREWWNLSRDGVNEKRREHYKNRKESGLCVICGRENDTNGICCSKHAQYQNDFALDQKTPVAGSRFYVWLKKNNYPPGFQILCYNCNCAKGHFGYCPHNLEHRQDWNTDFGIAV